MALGQGYWTMTVAATQPTQAPPADLAAFCRAEHPRLVGTLGLYTGDPHLAEELAQDALLRACRDWDRVRTFDAPGAWVHRVAINLANSAFRRRAAQTRAVRRLHGRPVDPAPPDHAGALALKSALAGLPSQMRAAIVLRYFADLSVAEAARAMELPEGTVKTLTARGIAKLRAAGLADLEVPDA